jgi:hypothetical protein
MYHHVSVGLALALAVVALGSAEASTRGRSKGPNAGHRSNAAVTAKSTYGLLPKVNLQRSQLSNADHFATQATWKNSRF